MEAANLSVAIPHDNERVLADLHGEVVTSVRNLAIMSHEQPIAIPDGFQFEPVIRLTGIKIARQSTDRLIIGKSGKHGLLDVHCTLRVGNRHRQRYYRNIDSPLDHHAQIMHGLCIEVEGSRLKWLVTGDATINQKIL